MLFSPTGNVYSRGPGKYAILKDKTPQSAYIFLFSLHFINRLVLGMYKIPGFADIPAEFNVSLLKGAPNPRAVYSSKAVGEPPLFLASSVFFAIKEAIKDARREEGLDENFHFISPATSSRIRMACEDRFTRKVYFIEQGAIRLVKNQIILYNFSSQNQNPDHLLRGM